ncbi:right-handed parallel beta-helix repeat-containing protein [Aquimarina aquimarini]|uniref:right-handed parallel beta-helix repeat-containing protein n=1 Tax=Aquimarina aquimarini TaxID=1191734 RepID=UPI00131EE790|nr:right-handed parallel beta-helix repeat-containing protein [Aquimarina aquimarini]
MALEINKTIKVNSVKEFFSALDDNTEIIIQCETFNFTLENLEQNIGIKEITEEHWYTHKKPIKRELKSYYFSSGLVLNGYQNLIIRSEEHTNIISDNDSDNILSFKNCRGIVLEGISIFHTSLVCSGSVLSILLSSEITIKDCSLNGSGVIGTVLIGANDVKFYNVNIYNNSFHAIYSINSFNIKFEECNIFDNHQWAESLIYSDVSYLTFKNCLINNNQSKKLIYTSLGDLPYANFENCEINNNPFIFNLQGYIEDSSQNNYALFKKEKRNAMLKLFIVFLMSQLETDNDNRNVEFVSLFSKDYKIIDKEKNTQSDFLFLYFSLKKKGFTINKYKIIRNRIVINENAKNQEIWSFSFNKNDKFKKIKIK